MKIVTVSNKIPTQPYYCWAAFHASLDRFGHKAVVLGMDQPWGGLMTKPRRLREWLRQNVEGDTIIVCDSWDVVFAENPTLAPLRVEAVGQIVWNAEKNLFPDPTLPFPEVGTPYRYLNSGFAMGLDYKFLALLEKMNLDSIPDDHIDAAGNHINPNDQLYFQQAFVNQLVPMSLDTTATMCQTLHGVTAEELDLTGERITNRVTGKAPIAFHMNGQKELWRDAILQKLNLPS
jgi:hypothetical protein